jgi:hypothetical protein
VRGEHRLTRTGCACAIVACGCAAASHAEHEREAVTCEFVVVNQTPHALEIRMEARALTLTPIGAVNPGELMTHAVPCALRQVWIAGIPIPSQVGGPVRFRLVQGHATLIQGERVEIALHWP